MNLSKEEKLKLINKALWAYRKAYWLNYDNNKKANYGLAVGLCFYFAMRQNISMKCIPEIARAHHQMTGIPKELIDYDRNWFPLGALKPRIELLKKARKLIKAK